jgi:hypothetical protein
MGDNNYFRGIGDFSARRERLQTGYGECFYSDYLPEVFDVLCGQRETITENSDTVSFIQKQADSAGN